VRDRRVRPRARSGGRRSLINLGSAWRPLARSAAARPRRRRPARPAATARRSSLAPRRRGGGSAAPRLGRRPRA
jgi:hypothetical protein